MIYVFKDDSGYQEFPKPSPNSKPYLEVAGTAEERILNGDRYRINDAGNAVIFLEPSEIEAENLAAAKPEKRRQIDSWRRAAEKGGFSYTFPDGITGTIQVRDSDDKANISGLAMGAQANPDGEFGFRDAQDQTHAMTAAEVLAMGVAVQNFITGNYAKGWSLKDQVDAATTTAEVEAITWE